MLNGSGTPNGEASVGYFRYSATSPGSCDDTFGTRVPAVSGTDLGTGSFPVAYSITATGLSQGVTYYYCSIVKNASGTAFGAILPFTIPSSPVVLTTGAAGLTSSSATLQGSANPVAAPTTGWFRYDRSSPGSCNDTFGTRVPSASGTPLGSGNVPVAYSQSIGSLLPGTTYYYCAIANNTYGTSYGTVQAFTTQAMAPTVVTSSASVTSATAATLNGSANPNGDATTSWFRYAAVSPGTCNDTFGTKTGTAMLGAGISSTSFSQGVAGLVPLTTYYYCAIAANALGTALGSVRTFTTPDAPTATTEAASGIGNTSVTLNGSGNPNRAAAMGWFRYSATAPTKCDDTFGSRAPVTGGLSLGSGSSSTPYSQSIGGLSSGATYYYCAIVSNSEGTAYGAVLSFTTAGGPTATSGAATGVTSGGATLNGSGNPNLASATGWFRFSPTSPATCSDTFGTRVPITSGTGVSLGAGSTSVAYSQGISGLLPGTTYYYCAIVSNAYGTAYGSLLSFTTAALAPNVVTSSASVTSGTAATLNGNATPNGDATTGWFRYAAVSPGTCNDTFGTKTATAALGAGTSAVVFSQAVAGLMPATMYYYCALGSNAQGLGVGSVRSFTTPSAPTAITTAALGVSNTAATLSGEGTPNRTAAAGWFRYSATAPAKCDDTFGSRAPTTGGVALGSGITSTPYTQAVTGLSAGTTYYYCAIVSNSEGTAYGAVLSFTTAGGPTATSGAATGVTSGGATLNGSGNPNLASATGWFRFSPTSPATCSDTFGTRVPITSGTGVSLGAGSASVAYSQGISGLLPGTTYYYCAIVSNAYGTAYGSLLSFTTAALAPNVVTSSASVTSGSGATLNGNATPNGDATTGWFRYAAVSPGTCNDTFGTKTATAALGAGTSPVVFSQAVAGLMPATMYYYCALGSNAQGLGVGSVRSFTTPSAPTAITTAALGVSNTAATLSGEGTPNRTAAAGWFRYSATAPAKCDDTFGSRAPTTGGVALGSGITSTPYTQAVTGLSAGTTYYYCAIVSNSEGTAYGAVLSFTTAGGPTATSGAATGVTSGGATLNGSGNPNLASATGWFRFSPTSPATCNDTFGTRVPITSGTGVSLGAGSTSVAYSQGISGLLPGTTYYYCAIVSNAYGTAYGSLLSFTTAALAPNVVTSSASVTSGSAATLNGNATPNGDATTGWFRYAAVSPGTCNDTFGTKTATAALGAGTSPVVFSQAVAGLMPATTYYYCALGSNAQGLAVGSVRSFTTPSAPTAITTAALGVSNTAATLSGEGTPNRTAAAGWFRYSATAPAKCDDTFGSRAPTTGGVALGSGITSTPYTQAVTGLSAGTTYYYCAIVSNSEGTAYGAVLSFTTAGGPTATSGAATGVTSGGATLNGSGNPNLASATGWFRFSPTSPATCSDTFGTRVPITSGTGVSLGAGSTSVAYSQGISGLLPGTTYYYCAIVSNAYGTAYGSLLSFTTAALAPNVVTSSASVTSGSGATLNGNATPNGDATTGWFRYAAVSPGTCNDTFGTKTATAALGAGTAPVVFSQAVAGLMPATTYYYCALGSNAQGLGVGSVRSFTTPSAPTAITTAAMGVSNTSATLSGEGTPNRTAAAGWFRYSATAPAKCDDTFGSRAPTTGGVALGSGITSTPYTQAVTGLSAGTTYYYCAIVSNSEGTAYGAVLSFITASAPTATTLAATPVAPTSATLNGSGNPNLAAATGWFRFSTISPAACNDTFGTRAPLTSGTGVSLGAGSASVPYSQTITGLLPGTTYSYCAIVSNAYGTRFGEILSFTTPPVPPVVTTSSPSGLTSTTATLNGNANPSGAATSGWFRIDSTSPGTCNDTFGSRLPAVGGTSLGAGNSAVAFSEPATALTPGQVYYYCAIASNAAGTTFGSVRAFTAPLQPTVSTLAATPVTATTATLNGTANPNGNATSGWFRYSSTNPGACTDAFGTRTPAAGGTNLGSGTAAVAYSQPISGLSPGTTYYFCAIAASPIGTTLGAVLAFTTPPSTPSAKKEDSGSAGAHGDPALQVTTLEATEITPRSAVVNATAVLIGDAAKGWFRYSTTDPGTCDDSFGMRVRESNDSALVTAGGALDFSHSLKDLEPGTTYYFCAIASSSRGTSFGSVLALTTKTAPPSTLTSPPTGVTGSAAMLNGAAVPNGDAATGWFRYSEKEPETCDDRFGVRVPRDGGRELGAGVAAIAWSESIVGLKPGQTYYYCAITANSLGTRSGELVAFVPGAAAPVVSTDAAARIEGTRAAIAGTVSPNGRAAIGWFRYGEIDPGTCDDSFGSRAPARGELAIETEEDPAAARAPSSELRAISASLSGLKPNTTYYYCAAASNLGGAAFGQILSFKTAPVLAELKSMEVAAEGLGVFTVKSTAEPMGAETLSWLRIDTTHPGTCNDSFGTRTPSVTGSALLPGHTAVQFQQRVSNLAAGTYYACAIAVNAGGLSYSEVQTFHVSETEAASGCSYAAASRAHGSGLWLLCLLPLLGCLLLRRRRSI